MAASTLPRRCCFTRSQRDSYAALDRPWWGPGTFNATLNWRAAVIGSFVVTFVDVDYYLLDGRVSIGLLERFCTVSRTDEPIDITLYDKDRQVVATRPQSRGRIIKLEKPQVYYLGLQSKKPTRYLISTSLMFDPAKLPHDVEMAEVFPEWWGKNPFVKAPKDPPTTCSRSATAITTSTRTSSRSWHSKIWRGKR